MSITSPSVAVPSTSKINMATFRLLASRRRNCSEISRNCRHMGVFADDGSMSSCAMTADRLAPPSFPHPTRRGCVAALLLISRISAGVSAASDTVAIMPAVDIASSNREHSSNLMDKRRIGKYINLLQQWYLTRDGLYLIFRVCCSRVRTPSNLVIERESSTNTYLYVIREEVSSIDSAKHTPHPLTATRSARLFDILVWSFSHWSDDYSLLSNWYTFKEFHSCFNGISHKGV